MSPLVGTSTGEQRTLMTMQVERVCARMDLVTQALQSIAQAATVVPQRLPQPRR